MKTLVNDPEISAYVAMKTGSCFGQHTSIGWSDETGIKAGLVYENWNGRNIFMHAAAEHGAVWMTRGSLYTMFAYPLIQCGCSRVTTWVEESNLASRRLVEHVGFVEEARLKGCASDGSDVILSVMTRENCRFLGDRYAAHA